MSTRLPRGRLPERVRAFDVCVMLELFTGAAAFCSCVISAWAFCGLAFSPETDAESCARKSELAADVLLIESTMTLVPQKEKEDPSWDAKGTNILIRRVPSMNSKP